MTIDKEKCNLHLNKAADFEMKAFAYDVLTNGPISTDSELHKDNLRKANLYFKSAMMSDGTPMAQGENVYTG